MPSQTLAVALSFAALLAVSDQVAGQTTLALRGGASIATLGGDDPASSDSRIGLNVGGAVTFGVLSGLGIQVGGAFVQKGTTETEQGIDAKVSFDYLEIPLLLRLGVPTSGSISPHFVVGPAFSVNVGCEVGGSSEGVSASAKCSELDINIKSIDVGGMAGVGMDIATSGSLSITLDIFYNLGLSSIDDSGTPDDIKNRAWSVLAGISLPLCLAGASKAGSNSRAI